MVRLFSKKLESGYRSKFEERVAQTLHDAGVLFSYEPCKIPYRTNIGTAYCYECGSNRVGKDSHYIPDFVIGDCQNSGVILEAKGVFNSAEREKILAVRRDNPHLFIVLVFQRDHWITKKHKSRYTDWCKKNDFHCVVGSGLDDEWIRTLKKKSDESLIGSGQSKP